MATEGTLPRRRGTASHLALPTAPAHDPTIVKMALISRTFDEWADADNRLRDYLTYCAAFDRDIDYERTTELHLEAAAAKARWIEATR